MREAVVMQMTWPGAPTIYYGDEAGVCGFTDPDNRRTYPWGREDQQMLEFHRKAIACINGIRCWSADRSVSCTVRTTALRMRDSAVTSRLWQSLITTVMSRNSRYRSGLPVLRMSSAEAGIWYEC